MFVQRLLANRTQSVGCAQQVVPLAQRFALLLETFAITDGIRLTVLRSNSFAFKRCDLLGQLYMFFDGLAKVLDFFFLFRDLPGAAQAVSLRLFIQGFALLLLRELACTSTRLRAIG